MAELFNAYAQGVQLGQQQRRQREQRNQLAELQSLAPQVIGGNLDATNRAYALDPDTAKTYQQEGNRQQQQLLGLARTLKQSAQNPQMQAAVYRQAVPFLRSNFGDGIPDEFDAAAVMPVVDQLLQVAENTPGAGLGGGVQSTYVDNNGNRVAIYRDGSTQILGGNDAGMSQQTLTIDVNGTPTQVTFDKRTGRYTNASLGGPVGAPMPQQPPQGGYQQINGQQTFIDPALPPEVQAQIRQSLAAGQDVPAQMAFAGQPLTGRRKGDEATS